jgi:SNF2 family DNA or RNA helicase
VEVQNLLDAVERGERWVLLDDGTYGMVPQKWARSLSFLRQAGQTQKNGTLRFSSSQGILLDSILSSERGIELQADKRYREFSKRLAGFRGLKNKKEPAGFRGNLRPYQREGLSWLEFLSDFGMGGILADDMGLGKTVQVLAFLRARRVSPKLHPSLIIAPKSLIHNWIAEAERFAPGLKTVHYTGAAKYGSLNSLVGNCDLLLITYQSLRIDFEKFRDFEFDSVIADEAQAIKNGQAQISLACRQIRAKYRLAMTGTPVENSVEDLFSILDFVDPGLIGPALKRKFQASNESESLAVLSRAIRPVVLRRTKEQVLKDLPEKTEQILLCELSKEQMRNYASFRDQIRLSLSEEIDREGIARSRIQILTALLRLRQLACHPGLVDVKQRSSSSPKLELLIEQLREVLGEGHRALVFSQFTQFLEIVAGRLKKEGISYEYLDGKTRDRKGAVERFQNDGGSKVFLLSLKAGGTGLNLTAADYVFILDPWWNPAVESQAIDRAHRIGQKNKVFAYRLVAQGTIEEKILKLQSSKKDLAQALIQENQAFLKKMTREDLEALLS